MPAEVKQVCCCVPRTWVNVIAWLQIVLCAVGVVAYIIFLTIISRAYPAKEGKFADRKDKDLAIYMVVLLLIICVVDLILGVLLLIGNKKEKQSWLTLWLILTGISIAISIIADVIKAAAGAPIQLVSAAFTCAIGGFVLYVVHSRACEITSRQESSVDKV